MTLLSSNHICDPSFQHPKSREPMVNYTLDPPAKGFAALDPNHTHHFLVDDGISLFFGIRNWIEIFLDHKYDVVTLKR